MFPNRSVESCVLTLPLLSILLLSPSAVVVTQRIKMWSMSSLRFRTSMIIQRGPATKSHHLRLFGTAESANKMLTRSSSDGTTLLRSIASREPLRQDLLIHTKASRSYKPSRLRNDQTHDNDGERGYRSIRGHPREIKTQRAIMRILHPNPLTAWRRSSLCRTEQHMEMVAPVPMKRG